MVLIRILNNANEAHFYDHSPWCWVKFTEGVSVSVGDSRSNYSGNFYIEGIVDYWAKDYLEQIHSLEIVHAELNALKLDDYEYGKSEITYYETWEIGIRILHWLKLIVLEAEFEEIYKSMRILKGLAIRHDFYYILGEVEEIFQDLNQGGNLAKALHDSTTLSGKMVNYFQSKVKTDYECIINAAVDFELLILSLWGIKKRGSIPKNFPNMDSLHNLPLPKEIKQRISDYIESGKKLLSGRGGNLDNYLREGEKIEVDISNYFAQCTAHPKQEIEGRLRPRSCCG
jgi:hypothetical protein